MHRSEFGHHSVHSPYKAHVSLDYGCADCPLVGCLWDTVASNFGMWPLFFSFIRVHLRMVLIETLVKQVFVVFAEDYTLLYCFPIFG
jgi:hypothetical protein